VATLPLCGVRCHTFHGGGTSTGGITDKITARTKAELREKIREWKQRVRDMDWDIRWVTEPEENGDGQCEVEVSAHS